MKHLSTFALKGNICFSLDKNKLSVQKQSYLVCQNGVCAGVFKELPESFHGIPVRDAGDALIIPGLSDIHLHAPQYSFRGMGMDLELLDWLNTITFPEEAKYADLDMPERRTLFL